MFTQDPEVIIEHQDNKNNFLIYGNTVGERWLIWGQCNQCGECIEGANNSDNRPASERLDCPVRPEIGISMKNCTLRGVYLNGD